MNLAVARILDANHNRAREAMRVMEDHARFALDHEPLAQKLKDMRHALTDAMRTVEPSALIAARDTANDVGTGISSEGEYERKDAESVAFAAGKRLGEALRVLEEYAKTIDPSLARRIEQLRYTAYGIEKEMCHLMRARATFGDVRLYVLLTESMCVLPWLDVIARVAQSVGRCCFQLREKDLCDAALLERAGKFSACCRNEGAISIINDRPDIAAICDADGVHVGQDDLDVQTVRRVAGAEKLVGISTHSKAQGEAAIKQNPDYIAVGPMFASHVKPGVGAVSPSVMREVAELTRLPKVAIGGIDSTNVSQVFDAGADLVAVCSAVLGSDDPGAVAAQLVARE
ncbi:MAG: thiamine phosphate synthase [Planctomycetes bacterium]|nr:thiamine phosphate synthase [Planctomycetota bacterium]